MAAREVVVKFGRTNVDPCTATARQAGPTTMHPQAHEAFAAIALLVGIPDGHTFMRHMSQYWDMHPARWLEVAFGAESRVRILRHLLHAPRRAWTEREIAAAIGMSPNAVNQAIRSLRATGLIHVEAVGRAHAVRLSRDPLLVSALARAFSSEEELWTATLDKLRASLPAGAICYLHGSSARGSAHGESDVDLLIVAKTKEKAIEAAYAVESEFHAGSGARLQIIALGERDAKKRALKTGVVKSAIEEGRLLSEFGLERGAPA